VVIEDGLDEDGDSLDEHDGPEAPSISVHKAMAICKQMDMVCSGFPKGAHDSVSTLELQQQLWLMCGHLCHLDLASQKQSTLDAFFKKY